MVNMEAREKGKRRMKKNKTKSDKILQYLESSLGYEFKSKRLVNGNKKKGIGKRKYDYARKLYCKLVRDTTNLTLEDIANNLNLTHASVVNALNKFHYLDDQWINIYNECILDLKLNIPLMNVEEEPKEELSEIRDEDIKRIVVKLKQLNPTDLITFEQTRLNTYLKFCNLN